MFLPEIIFMFMSFKHSHYLVFIWIAETVLENRNLCVHSIDIWNCIRHCKRLTLSAAVRWDNVISDNKV